MLGVCHLLGIDTVYRIGGFALAALAVGTERIAPVEMLAGPSNIYGQEAKRQLFGVVGIDGLYGPSEIVVLADDAAHPPGWRPTCWRRRSTIPEPRSWWPSSGRWWRRWRPRRSQELLAGRARRDALKAALQANCALVQVPDRTTACELIDRWLPSI